MKLTDQQRATLEDKLAEAQDLWPPDQAAELAPLIEGWLSTPPEGWTEREDWGVRYDIRPDVPGYKMPNRDAAEELAAEDPHVNTHVVRSTVWASPWEDA